jgi:hypothetical protein
MHQSWCCDDAATSTSVQIAPDATPDTLSALRTGVPAHDSFDVEPIAVPDMLVQAAKSRAEDIAIAVVAPVTQIRSGTKSAANEMAAMPATEEPHFTRLSCASRHMLVPCMANCLGDHPAPKSYAAVNGLLCILHATLRDTSLSSVNVTHATATPVPLSVPTTSMIRSVGDDENPVTSCGVAVKSPSFVPQHCMRACSVSSTHPN